MGREATAATRHLAAREVPFSTHLYRYEERGGTSHAATSLGVSESAVVKTLVMRTDTGERVLVLMHGDRLVSEQRLARELGVRRIVACSPDEALRVTGYVVGGISPFGTRTPLLTCVERSILDLEWIYLNGGRRGLLLRLSPDGLKRALELREVSVAR